MFVITGGTGNTGKLVAKHLLEAGHPVRVITRHAEKAAALAEAGAEIEEGDLTDLEFLNQAFAGAKAVYLMIPSSWQTTDLRGDQNKVVECAAKAIEKNGIQYAVTLSSVGAHLPENAGVVQGLYDMEQRLNKIEGLNVLHLRAGYFMENHLGNVAMIKHMGILGSPIVPDMPISMVATADIAAVAAERMKNLDFKNSNVQYVLGAKDYTMTEAAKILGAAIGKPELSYVQFPYEAAQHSMLNDWGLSESYASAMVEFMRTMNEGDVSAETRRDENNTTPTSLEQFAASTFAYVYNM